MRQGGQRRHVDRDLVRLPFEVMVEERAGKREASVVDKQVDRKPARLGFGVDPGRRRRVCKVGRDHGRLDLVRGPQVRRECLKLGGGSRDEHDVGAALGKPFAEGFAKAGRRTGDEGGGVGIVEHRQEPSRLLTVPTLEAVVTVSTCMRGR